MAHLAGNVIHTKDKDRAMVLRHRISQFQTYWKQRTTHSKHISGSFAVGIFSGSIILVGIIAWTTNQAMWDLTLDPQGPTACQQGVCQGWRINSSANSLAFEHGILSGQYICLFNGHPVTPQTSVKVIEAAYELTISNQPTCSAVQTVSLVSDIVPSFDAIIDLLIVAVCSVLAVLIYRYATQRQLVRPMVGFLLSCVIAVAWLPGGPHYPLVQEIEVAISASLCPTLLCLVLRYIFFPQLVNRLSRFISFILPIMIIIGCSFAGMTLIGFLIHADNICQFFSLLRRIFQVSFLLLIVALVIIANFTARHDERQRESIRILGGGILVAFIPLIIFGALPVILPVHLIISNSTAITTFLAVPLTLAYVIVRRDLLSVDSLIRRVVRSVLGHLIMALTLVIALSIVEQITSVPLAILALMTGPFFVLGVMAPLFFRGSQWLTEIWLFPEIRHYRTILARTFGSNSVLKPATIGDRLIGQIIEAFPVHTAALLVRDEKQGAFIHVAWTALTDPELLNTLLLPLEHPLAKRLEQGNVVDNAAGLPGTWGAIVPVCLGDKLLAFLAVGPRTDGDPFSAIDRTTMLTLVEHQALALDYARVVDELHHSIKHLRKLDEMKNEFMMTAQHELRTPISGLTGFVEFMAEMTPEQRRESPELIDHCIDQAMRTSRTVRAMIEEFLHTDRISELSVKTSWCDAGALTTQTVESLQVAAEFRDRHMDVHVEGEVKAWADPEQVKRVLINLISNANKYSPLNKPIEIEVDTRTTFIEIVVRDQGSGVPKSDREKIFEKFVRLERDTNSPVRGSGLGLHIVQRIVQAMGGRVWVEDNEKDGIGSAFHVTLPCDNGLSGEQNELEKAA
jgi:signal transduction histidine kinase